ncbi:MAG TPA: GNAT family N-acetyltransferase [Bacteroidia bacterium]|jgi:predicted N-acetyltransferase YhbS
MSYEFVPISTDGNSIREIAALLKLVFPQADKYSFDFLDWQYRQNPNGKIRGFNALYNGKLAAHYAIMPIVADIFGQPERGLLSLNTATHPDHQGKRLFTTLANMSYKAAGKEGYGFVVGVANANSTPGFVNHLGFQLVGPLEAKLGIGEIVRKELKVSPDFIKRWSEPSIQWRVANPKMQYQIKGNNVFSKTDKPLIKAMLVDSSMALPLQDNVVNIGFRPVQLWIGIDQSINWKRSFYFNVPQSMRPSPLNFIFKDLTSASRKLNIKNVRFSAFDFDAY